MEGADYVIHAAALKQVPSCEFFPLEAVRTNVLGTEHVLEAAAAAGVKALVCLSTDKAAYPINAMGASKALMEKSRSCQSRLPGAESYPDHLHPVWQCHGHTGQRHPSVSAANLLRRPLSP